MDNWTTENVVEWATKIIGDKHASKLLSQEVNGKSLFSFSTLSLSEFVNLFEGKCNIPVGPGAELYNELHLNVIQQEKRSKRSRGLSTEEELYDKKRKKVFNFDDGVVDPVKFYYGVYDFATVSKGFYVDRTGYIPDIEEAGNYLVFLRPRRFGKSLLLSMLKHYYDIRYKDNFHSLFGHLEIAKQEVQINLHNSFLVLEWNFAGLDVGGDNNRFEISLNDYINSTIKQFKSRYQHLLNDEIHIYPESINSFLSLRTAIESTTEYRSKLYVLIDEYDTGVNEAVRNNNKQLVDYLKKDQGILSTYRILFSKLKEAAGEAVGRVFITGVSPLALNDFTSGYNISKNITVNPIFSLLCGFTQTEVTQSLNLVLKDTKRQHEALEIMKKYFNGYSFHIDQQEKVYNSTMIIYFLSELKQTNKFQISDPNVNPSEAVLRFISQNPHTPKIIMDLLSYDFIEINRLYLELNITHLVEVKETDTDFLLSFLFYLGALTFNGKNEKTGKIQLAIPNEQIRNQYLKEIQHILEITKAKETALQTAITQMFSGDIEPLCFFIKSHILDLQKYNDVIHSMENTLKSAFILAFSIARGSEFAYSEFELTNTQADAVFLQSLGPGIHIEFKNTTVGQIQGHYTPNNWERMNQFSEEIDKMDKEEVKTLKLKQFTLKDMYCPYYRKTMITVLDKWNNLLEQTKDNRMKLLQNYPDKQFISYAVYRVGLKRLFHQKLEL